MLKGADILVSELKDQGVSWISTLCGNGLNQFYISCSRAGVRLIDTHNEQAAAYIADAYARLTGRVGVCAVSSGIAHSNALTGVANAYFDGAPLLLITGASVGYGAGRGVFQEFDQVALAAPICKYAKAVTRISDLAYLVREAFAYALSGRPGPVHLTIPIDIMEGEIEEGSGRRGRKHSTDSIRGWPDHNLIVEAAKMIMEAERPLIIAGSGVFYDGGQESLMRFSEETSIPIVIPIWDRGSVDQPHPNFLGVIGAASGEARTLEDADLIILAGARVDYRVGFLEPPKVREDLKIIRISRDICELRQGIEPNIAIPASSASVFKYLTEELKRLGWKPKKEWLDEVKERWRIFRSRWTGKPLQMNKPISGRHIVEAIRPLLKEDLIFLIDGGNIGQWAHMILADSHYPSYWLTCGASAVVGWGIPGAMGAKLAYPDRPVLLLSGDGAFSFTITELESAARHRLPFVAVVANDSAWGLVVSEQRRRFGEEGVISSRFGDIRFDMIAKGLGAEGLRVEDPKDLTSTIQTALSEDTPVVIDVPTSLKGTIDYK